MPGKNTKKEKTPNGASLGFEEKLWKAADKLRGHMDPGEYKHVALGLVFLKYISDAFEGRRAELAKEKGADLEDRDEYAAVNIFWVPKQARWPHLQANAQQPAIGKLLDDAMVAIEKENPSLKGVLSKDYARPSLDSNRSGTSHILSFPGPPASLSVCQQARLAGRLDRGIQSGLCPPA